MYATQGFVLVVLRFFAASTAFLVVYAGYWPGMVAHGQDFQGSTVASSFLITGDADNGDIIAYDATTNTYVRATRVIAEDIFGVVVDDPVVHVTDNRSSPGTRPLVRFGEATVNVSTRAGVIRTGDYVTVGDIPGVGERSPRDAKAYLLGIALSDMVYDVERQPEMVQGVEVRRGTVPVAIRFGFFDPGVRDAGDTQEPAPVTGGAVGSAGEGQTTTEVEVDDYVTLFRYALAAAIALAAVAIALKSFGGTLSQSVVSVGRNPLARRTIISMMIWNTMLIFLVSGMGFAIGAAIIFLP